MSQGTPPTNGRVTIAVVGNKVDNLTAIVKTTAATVDNMRRELGQQRQVAAVNEERWRNHDAARKAAIEAHDKADVQLWETHGKEHARENRIITVIAGGFSAASGFISAMFSR